MDNEKRVKYFWGNIELFVYKEFNCNLELIKINLEEL